MTDEDKTEVQIRHYIYDKDTGDFLHALTASAKQLEAHLLTGNYVTGDEPPVSVSREQVNAERDRRIEENLVFDGDPYQFDEMSKQRIAGAATLAGFAIGRGVPEGSLRWANPDNDFVFITSEDKFVPMDAHKCFAFGTAAAQHETAHIFAASSLKKTMPLDYKDDKYWPKK